MDMKTFKDGVKTKYVIDSNTEYDNTRGRYDGRYPTALDDLERITKQIWDSTDPINRPKIDKKTFYKRIPDLSETLRVKSRPRFVKKKATQDEVIEKFKEIGVKVEPIMEKCPKCSASYRVDKWADHVCGEETTLLQKMWGNHNAYMRQKSAVACVR